MIFINLFIFFIFGAIIGSFINVIVLRYQTGRSFITGRSQCFSCGKTLSFYELFPILSFFILNGKCSSCKSKISYQYPAVEFITGLIFLGIFLKLGVSSFLPFYLFIVSILIAISVYDFRHKIIPDGMVFILNIFSLIVLFLIHGFSNLLSMPGLLELLSGPILFGFFALLWLVSSGRWMGFGDAKLALGVGWFLGFTGGIFAIMAAFWVGAAYSVAILTLQKLKLLNFHLTRKSEIPFAPFIIIGLFLQFFTGWNLSTVINTLN